MAYRVPIDSLMASLNKTGLPMGNSVDMQNAGPVAPSAIQSQVYGSDTQGPDIKANFMKQLDQVAQMDKKLGAVYSDPTSPLYTDNVLARERIISGAHSTNSSAVKGFASRYKSNQDSLDQQVSETVDLYKQLTALQAKEEARAEKEAKAAIKGGGKASGSSKLAVSKITQQKRDLAHLSDDDARAYFDNTPAKFQTYWIGKLQEGEIPPTGFNLGEVKNEYEYWINKFKPETPAQVKKKAAPAAQTKPLF